MKTSIKLTPQVEATITAYILGGAFPHVASEAAGVPSDLFDLWMKWGEGKRGKKQYKLFRIAVLKAKAEARCAAEFEAFKRDPIAWLKNGPGKESEESRGWTIPVKPLIVNDNRSVNITSSPELQHLMAKILGVLDPESRARVAQVLSQKVIPNQG